MWITISRAVDLAEQQGISRAEIADALRSGDLPTDRPDPRGPAQVVLQDLNEWTAQRTSR